jgi:hypothetical protein
VDQQTTNIVERVDVNFRKTIELIDKRSLEVIRLIQVQSDTCLKLVDERTDELIKLVDLRSRECIEVLANSANQAINVAEYSLIFFFLLIAYVLCGNLEKFLEFSLVASGITFVVCLLLVNSSPSRIIQNPVIFYFSLTYFGITYGLFFLSHAVPRMYSFVHCSIYYSLAFLNNILAFLYSFVHCSIYYSLAFLNNALLLLILCLKISIIPILLRSAYIHYFDYKQNDLSSSKIILNKKQKEEIVKLCEFSLTEKWQLLYRGTNDGFEARKFHSKCDGHLPTLTIVKVRNSGNIFGGYTEADWSGDRFKTDSNAFIFSLKNKDNKPCKIRSTQPSLSIRCGPSQGPSFGFQDITLTDSVNYSALGSYYHHSKYARGSHEAKTFLAGEKYFKIDEIEVYKREKSFIKKLFFL